MNREQAINLIVSWYPMKGREWAESQLDRCVNNVDGPVEDFEGIVETIFNPNSQEDL